jgi:hypothetical protein
MGGIGSAAGIGAVVTVKDLQATCRSRIAGEVAGEPAGAAAADGVGLDVVEELGKGYRVWYVTVPREGGVKHQ